MDHRQLGVRLRAAREARHLTAAQAADTIGTDPGDYRSIQSGDRALTGRELEKSADLIGLRTAAKTGPPRAPSRRGRGGGRPRDLRLAKATAVASAHMGGALRGSATVPGAVSGSSVLPPLRDDSPVPQRIGERFDEEKAHRDVERLG